MRPATKAAQSLLDAHLVATLIRPAINNMTEWANDGLPTQTPGASTAQAQPAEPCGRTADCTETRPCPIHDPDARVELTSTERAAINPDKIRQDHDRLIDHINKAAHHNAAAATIALRWGYRGLTTTDIKARLGEINASIWCEHCSRMGRYEPREEGRTLCWYCREYNGRWDRPINKTTWDARDARNNRLSDQDIRRLNPGIRLKADKKKRGNAA